MGGMLPPPPHPAAMRTKTVVTAIRADACLCWLADMFVSLHERRQRKFALGALGDWSSPNGRLKSQDGRSVSVCLRSRNRS
jgi:hypothetical protein